MKRMIISEEERKRILGMHVEATKRHYGLVSEQDRVPYTENGVTFRYPAITSKETLEKFVNYPLDTPDTFSVSSWKNLTKKGLETGFDFSDEIAKGSLDNNSKIVNVLRTYKDGLTKVAELGRLLKSSDITTELRAPLAKSNVRIADDVLVTHINTLAKNAQKTFFPNNPLS